MNIRQQQIIEFAKSNTSFQNKEVVLYFDNEYSRETITRDLAYLVKYNSLTKRGAGAFVKYSLAKNYELIKDIDIEEYYKPHFIKRKIKMQFNWDIFDLLNENFFTRNELEKLEKLNDKYILKKKKLQKESLAIFRKEWERLVIEFSWKSSEIEGGTYTLLETEALIKEMHFAEGKDKLDAQMILNHKKALDFVVQNEKYFQELTLKKINKMHELLTVGLGINMDYRDRIVTISGTLYRPLFQREDVIEAIRKMIKIVEAINNPFIQAFVVLIMTAYIQPFDDGNKRTSRMLANAILHANGKAMLSYRDVDTVEYKKAVLLFYEQNNISYFKKIFLEQFDFAVNEYFL